MTPWAVACQAVKVHGISYVKNTGVGCCFLLQGSFCSKNQTHIYKIHFNAFAMLYFLNLHRNGVKLWPIFLNLPYICLNFSIFINFIYSL